MLTASVRSEAVLHIHSAGVIAWTDVQVLLEEKKKMARTSSAMKRAIFPRNMKRIPKSASSAMVAMKNAAFLICPGRAPEKPVFPEALLP